MIIKRPIGEKGQVVIPNDIRKMLNLQKGNQVIFEIENEEIKIKKENPREFLDNFFKIIKKKKKITLRELKKIEDESYDLP